MNDNLATVTRVYDAFKTRDVEVILGAFAPDVVITQASQLPWGGAYQGHDGAVTFFVKLVEHVNSEVTTENLFAAGDHVVQTGRTRGTLMTNGAAFDIPEVHLWQLRDGKVVRYDAYIDTLAMLDALHR